MSAGPPRFAGVLETCLYHDGGQAEAMREFYAGILGLPLVARWPDGMAFRVGAGVLLLFDRELLAAGTGPVKAHGADGPGHACLRAGEASEYEAWSARLAAAGVEVTHEQAWDAGRRSLYFADPAGNLLEIADADLWPGAADGG